MHSDCFKGELFESDMKMIQSDNTTREWPQGEDLKSYPTCSF